jgi:hypothetical protein
MDPRAALDDIEMRKFLILRGFELDPSVIQPVAIQTALSQTTILICTVMKSLKIVLVITM